MAHVAKYTRGALGHMFAHYERAKGKDNEYIKFGNYLRFRIVFFTKA